MTLVDIERITRALDGGRPHSPYRDGGAGRRAPGRGAPAARAGRHLLRDPRERRGAGARRGGGVPGGTARLMPLAEIHGMARAATSSPAPRPTGSRWARSCSAGWWTARCGRWTADRCSSSATGRCCTPLPRRPSCAAGSASRSPLGIRSIDACLTVGEGQRLAVLAGPGVGKSVLLGHAGALGRRPTWWWWRWWASAAARCASSSSATWARASPARWWWWRRATSPP